MSKEKPRHRKEVPLALVSNLTFPSQREILKRINETELIGTYEQVDDFFVKIATHVAGKVFTPPHALVVWLEFLEQNANEENQLNDLVNDNDFEKFVRVLGADDLFVERAESFRERATRLHQQKVKRNPQV